jgi:hypothetical protein
MDKEDLSTVLTQLPQAEATSVTHDAVQSMFGHEGMAEASWLLAARDFADQHDCNLAFDERTGEATFRKR